MFFFFNDTATTEIYTLSLHDALPISEAERRDDLRALRRLVLEAVPDAEESVRYGMPHYERGGPLCPFRSEEHTSGLQSRQYPVCRLLLEKTKAIKNT